MPDAQCTRSLVCVWDVKNAHEYSQRVHRNHPAFPHAMVYGLYRALPGDRAFLPPSPCENDPQDLAPASRRQDHTSSPSASVPFVIGTFCVHRIPPRVRDDREPPLMWDGTAAICEVIWVGREGAIFLEMGLDTHPKSAAKVSSRTAGHLSSCGKRRKSTLHEITPPKCVIDPAPACGVPNGDPACPLHILGEVFHCGKISFQDAAGSKDHDQTDNRLFANLAFESHVGTEKRVTTQARSGSRGFDGPRKGTSNAARSRASRGTEKSG